MGRCRRQLLGLLAVALAASPDCAAAAGWTVLDCPGPPGVNLNDTQPGHPAVCSHKNTEAADVMVEMNFQVAGAEKTLGSLSCAVSSGGPSSAATRTVSWPAGLAQRALLYHLSAPDWA